VVAACTVTAAFAWGLGLFGASVYLKSLSALHGWSISLISGAITGFYLTSAASAAVVGAQIDRRGARPVLVAGALALAAGVFAIGQIGSALGLYLSFALLGVGWSCLSSTGLSATLAPWFERHQGRATTLALMGASAGSILGVPLLLLAIERLGLDVALAATAVLTLVVLLPLHLSVLRHRRPEDIGQWRDGLAPAPARPGAPLARAPLSRSQALRSGTFWRVAVAFALALTMQIGFLTHHVTLSAPLMGAAGAGLLVSGAGLAALSGRILLARIVDQVDVRLLGAAMMLMQAISLAIMALWPARAVLIGSSLTFGFTVGMVTTLSPVIIRREFGPSAFGAIYGAAATLIQFTSAFGPGLYGVMRDAFGSYRPGLAVAAVVNAGAALVLMQGRRAHGLVAESPRQCP